MELNLLNLYFEIFWPLGDLKEGRVKRELEASETSLLSAYVFACMYVWQA